MRINPTKRCYDLSVQDLFLLAEAADTAKEGIPWTTVLTAIVSVPATIFTLIGSAWLIKKTRLENRKLELEIEEKEIALGKVAATSSDKAFAELVAQPLFEGRRVQEIILRSILLILMLQAWKIGGLLLTYLTPSGVFYTFYPRPSQWILTLLYLIILLIKVAPIVGYYVVLLGMGTSIVLDILRHLNIRIPNLVDRLGRGAKIWYVLLTVVVAAIAVSRYAEPFHFTSGY